MFLRRNRREHGVELYEYWTLVESVRTARGPRQRVVATLGKLPSLDQDQQRGWEQIAQLLNGREAGRQAEFFESVVSAFLCAGRFLALLSNTQESRWKQLSTFLMFFKRRQPRKIVLQTGWPPASRLPADFSTSW
jgi:hypothetical protein